MTTRRRLDRTAAAAGGAAGESGVGLTGGVGEGGAALLASAYLGREGHLTTGDDDEAHEKSDREHEAEPRHATGHHEDRPEHEEPAEDGEDPTTTLGCSTCW
jgi:hypothetical protein